MLRKKSKTLVLTLPAKGTRQDWRWALHLVEGVAGKGQVQEDHRVVVGRVGEPECVAIAQRGRVDARWD